MTPVVLLLFVAPLLSCIEAFVPRDCSEIHKWSPKSPSGIYTIYPDLRNGATVYCDMKDSGYTVIQTRKNGLLNFYQPWYRYVRGFGNASGEYWLGLDNIHQLTLEPQKLVVEMEDFEGNKASANYSSFSVGAECEGYKLTVSRFTDGGAGDSLISHNDMKFSTYDKDHDRYLGNCAQRYYGGWWYGSCHASNPNGVYRWGEDSIYAVGVIWKTWKGYHYSLKSLTMKIHPSD